MRKNPLFTISLVALTLSLGVVALFNSCCNCVYDDLSSCPQGIAFKFHSLTPCGDQLSLDAMKNIEIQVYNMQGQLVQTFPKTDIQVNEDYTLGIPFFKEGQFTFVFWGMEDKETYTTQPHEGVSIALTPNLLPTVSQHLSALFYGQSPKHEIIDRSKLGTRIDTLDINMLPYNYNINISILGLEDNDNAKYHIVWEDDNIEFDANGQIISKPVKYVSKTTKQSHGKDFMYKASFNTLKLSPNGHSRIIITKEGQDKPIKQLSLTELLSALEKEKGVKLNLECTHNLDIQIEDITYERILVRINEWNFVHRIVILGE